MTNNLPEPDDAPWLNLSQEEINQLRNQKYQLTKYGKEKIREKILAIGRECMIRYDEALKKLADK